MLPYCQGINKSRREEEQMMNKLGKVVAKVAVVSAKTASKSTSMVGFYQPIVPKQLKAEKKSEKK